MAELFTALTYTVGVLFFFYVGLCSGRSITGSKHPLTPVVIIPGHGGNQMNMKIDRKDPVSPHCPTSTNGWIHGWLNLWSFLPSNLECWVRHNKMAFDSETKQYRNTEGVLQEVPGWGEVETIEFLDPSLTAYVLGNVGSYFAPLIRELEIWGYKRGVNIRGAPYDFRFAPPSMPNFYEPLRRLIEDTYATNGNARVALVAHSMGGLLGYYFINQQDREWKKKYIHSFTTMSTPWKGLVVMAEAMMSGYTWGIDGLHPNTFRILQRSCESGVFMLPSASEWGTNDVIVQTPMKNYTTSEYVQLFEDIDYPIGAVMWKEIKDEIMHLKNPGIDTWCFYGSGIPTTEALVYNVENFPDGPPHRMTGDGDGTANLRSASACKQWEDTIDNLVVTKEFEKMEHNDILSSKRMFDALKEILGA